MRTHVLAILTVIMIATASPVAGAEGPWANRQIVERWLSWLDWLTPTTWPADMELQKAGPAGDPNGVTGEEDEANVPTDHSGTTAPNPTNG